MFPQIKLLNRHGTSTDERGQGSRSRWSENISIWVAAFSAALGDYQLASLSDRERSRYTPPVRNRYGREQIRGTNRKRAAAPSAISSTIGRRPPFPPAGTRDSSCFSVVGSY